MTRHAYDVRDPAQLVHDISEQVVLSEGTAHLALVAYYTTYDAGSTPALVPAPTPVR